MGKSIEVNESEKVRKDERGSSGRRGRGVGKNYK
jgi:hypothetical protein